MSKHTETPWEVGTSVNGVIQLVAPDGKCPVQVWDYPEAEANAKFIVNACNSHQALVEACKLAIKGMEADSKGLKPHTRSYAAHEAYKAVQQALALAEKEK
jgi:hypothetical protein